MISLELSPEETELQRSTHRFAADHLRPLARRCDEDGDLPSSLVETFTNLGLADIGYPESWGGSDLGTGAVVVVEEELAWGDAGVATGVPRAGAAGAMLASLSQPPSAGAHNVAALRDRRASFPLLASTVIIGTDDRTGSLRLSGTIVALALHRADAVLVACRLENEVALVWLPLPAAGITVEVDSHQLGLRAAPLCTVTLDTTRIAGDQVVARGSAAISVLQWGLAREILLISARCVGTARAAFEYAAQYATQRTTFGRAIADHQAIAFMVADMGIRVDAARGLLWNAAWEIDRPQDTRFQARDIVSAAATFAAEHVVGVASDAVQILGGHGYIQDHPLEKWMRDARTLANHSASVMNSLTELQGLSA